MLSRGTFVVDEVRLNAELQEHGKVQINHSNCSLHFSGSGPATIGSGTGAYAGITGKLTITLNVADIAPRKGTSCNLNGQPKGAYAAAVGHGSVSFT